MHEITLMNDLMEQARQVKDQMLSDNKENKEDLLKRALKKIDTYCDRVLENSPFSSVNVEVTEEISLYIRKNGAGDALTMDEPKDATASEGYDPPLDEFIIIEKKNFYSQLFTTKKELDNSKWHSYTPVRLLDETMILLVMDNFDIIKSKVEATLMERMEKSMKLSMQSVKEESEAINNLKEFLK